VIEHNLDVLAEADWLIDMGPEGGSEGGQIVVQGPPELVCRQPDSHTGRLLGEFLNNPKTTTKQGAENAEK